jgi:hypothetical protein
MNKQAFTLDFSLPLTAQNWVDLLNSHVSQVMLALEFADIATLDRLRSMGVRVILRVSEDAYYDDIAPRRIGLQVQAATAHATVVAVIAGCEPDVGVNWRYGAIDWAQAHAYGHARRLDNVRRVLQAQGVRVVSPGWQMRSISEDEPAQPGRQTWAEIVRLTYDQCDGSGVHLYQYGWQGVVDELRVKFALREWQELYHKPLYLDEVGIAGSASPVDKMRAYLSMADMLIAHPLGERIAMFCPFVSNGTPNGQWDEHFLLDDPECYTLLGAWMLS